MNKIQIGKSKFDVVGTLGIGSYGTVFSVLKDKKIYALKVIDDPVKKTDNEGIKSLKELDIMGRISHPNLMGGEIIVSEFVKDVSRVGILMEKADSDLNKAMYRPDLTISDRYSILQQVVFGVKALHESGYLHLDLKPLNILMFGKTPKVSDFGLSILTENINGRREKYLPITTQTVDHRSINVINGSRTYKASDDVWSLGIIFLSVLAYGKSLFKGFRAEDFTEEKVKRVYEEKLSVKNIDTTLREFLVDPAAKKAGYIIKRMLDFNEEKRATITEILEFLAFNKNVYVSAKYKNPIIEIVECDQVIYEGFKHLFRLGTQFGIRLETFFLAADIYQRTLIYRNHSNSAEGKLRNIIYNATLSLYLAIKMVESYFADTEMLAKLSGNIFSGETLLIGETVLVNNLKGVLYPQNLFRVSTTERRLLQAFELLRNCFIYGKINLKKWREYSESEEKVDGTFNKYISFASFIGKTKYYREFLEGDVSTFFNSDQRE